MKSDAKPNLLFVIFDDLNGVVEGMDMHPQARTPNLRRLAQRGVMFTSAHCTSPLCAPSRPSMFTGLYPHTAGYFGGRPDHPDNLKCWQTPVYARSRTWMQHLAEHGYTIHGTGKVFHNGMENYDGWTDADGRFDFGYPVSWGPFPWDGNPQRPPFDTPEKHGRKASHVRHPEQPWQYYLSFYQPLSHVPDVPGDDEAPGYRGWTLYGEPFRYNGPDDRDLLPDELNAQWAADCLARQHDQPFALHVGFNRPHEPIVVPDEYYDMFPLDALQLPAIREDDWRDCGELFTSSEQFRSRVEQYHDLQARGELKKYVQAYLAATAFADAQFGRVLDALDASPHAQNTLVIVTADHGFHLGQKQRLFKWSPWEQSTRVPLIVAGPGVAAGGACDRPVSTVDLFPTLIDRLGLPDQPHGPDLPLDGHALSPLLEDPDAAAWTGPDLALTALANREEPDAKGVVDRQHYTLRSPTRRYIRYGNGEEELYDHRTDPHEWHNLATDPAHAAALAELRGRLHDTFGLIPEKAPIIP